MQKYEEKMKPKNFYQEKNVPRSVKTQFQERSYRNILALAIESTFIGQRSYLRFRTQESCSGEDEASRSC